MKRVRTNFTGVPGSPYVSNMYLGDSFLVQEAIDRVSEFWVILEPYMVNECQWAVEDTVVTIDAATGEIVSSASGTGGVGQGDATGEMLPPSNQILIQWYTGQYINGRELRGRTYVPAISSSNNAEGFLAPATRTAIIGDLETWYAAEGPPLIWSRAALETRAVASLDVWNQFAVLRSRRD